MKDEFTKIGGTKIGFAVTLCALAFILTLTAAPRAAGGEENFKL